MTGLVVITATGADVKLANRLLLYIKDWEFGADYMFKILRTRDEATNAARRDERDEAPLFEFSINEWEGLSISQVERTMIQKSDPDRSIYLFLLLDDEGVRDQTIVIAQRTYKFVDGKTKYLSKFNKTRVRWEEIYSMWCNLDIGNMGFESFCIEEHQSETTNYWWRYRSIETGGYYDEYIHQAERVIRELKKLDLA